MLFEDLDWFVGGYATLVEQQLQRDDTVERTRNY